MAWSLAFALVAACWPVVGAAQPAAKPEGAPAALEKPPAWGPQQRLDAEPVWPVSAIPAGVQAVPQERLLALRMGMSPEAVSGALGSPHSAVTSKAEAGQVWQYVVRDFAGNRAFIASLWFGNRGLWLASGRSRPVGELAQMPFTAPPLAAAGDGAGNAGNTAGAGGVAAAGDQAAPASGGAPAVTAASTASSAPAASAAQAAPAAGVAAPVAAASVSPAAPAAGVSPMTQSAPEPAQAVVGNAAQGASASAGAAPAASAAPAAAATVAVASVAPSASASAAATPPGGGGAASTGAAPPVVVSGTAPETFTLAPLVVQPAAQPVPYSSLPPLAVAGSTQAPAKPAAEAARGPDQTLALRDALDAWLGAWARQDVEAYLGQYTAGYAPPGRKRAEWERERRERLKQPVFIRVAAEEVSVQAADSARPRVSFVQRYESERYEEKSRKVLTFVKQGGRWLIEKEENVRLAR